MTGNSSAISKFIWADKVALCLALLAASVWGVAWWSAFKVIGNQGALYLWLHLGARWTNLGIIILMAAWLMMRALDFVAGGATYRLSQKTALGVEEMIASCGRAVAKLGHHQGPQIARQLDIVR